MYSAEGQQVEICLLKSNMEEIENYLKLQWSAVPELEAISNQKREKTMQALQEYRATNAQLETLKSDNASLSVTQVSLRRQCDDVSHATEALRVTHDKCTVSIAQEEREIDQLIHSYEVSMADKAERFRSTRGYYYEKEVYKEIERVNTNIIKPRETEARYEQKLLEEQTARAEGIRPEIPEGLLEICGKPELVKLVDNLQTEFEKLSTKRNTF